MRVLIFSLSYYPLVGGAEVAVKEITDRLPELEFDMVTLRFVRSNPKFERVGNINVYRLGGGFGYLSKILFVPQAAFFALRHKYDAFWAIMTNMTFPIAIARMFGDRTPYVLTLQDGDPFEYVFKRFRIRVFKPLLVYGFRHAAKVQTISTFLAEWATRMGYTGLPCVIPNGVDVERFSNPKPRILNPDNVTLIHTGRLVEKNAIGDVIEALKVLPPSIKFKVVGTGKLEGELKEKARKLGVGNRVEFVGPVPYTLLPKYLHQADIFVRPSLSEGMGNSFIEAMAAGIPVIGTSVGGITDFLKDGETGLFVEPKNPRLIAFQVQKLISDRVLRDKITIAAKRMVLEKYDWDLIAREMRDKVFRQI